MSNPAAAKYVSGVAVHWYLDWLTPTLTLDLTHQRHPNLFILYTEACTGEVAAALVYVKVWTTLLPSLDEGF